MKNYPHNPDKNWRVDIIKLNIETATKIRGLDLKDKIFVDGLRYVDYDKISNSDFNRLQEIAHG